MAMEDCGTQQEIFDEIQNQTLSSVGLGIKTAKDTLEGKTPSCRRKLQEKNELEVATRLKSQK